MAWGCLLGCLEFSVRVSVPFRFLSTRTRKHTHRHNRLICIHRPSPVLPQTPARTRPAPPCSPPPRLTPARARTTCTTCPAPRRPALRPSLTPRVGAKVPAVSWAPAAQGPVSRPQGRAEAGAETRQPVPRADAGGFFSARQARPGARGRCGSLLGRAAGRAGRPPADPRPPPATPRPGRAGP